ncbi:OprD family porin [Azomonas macrocytogenes]|uniref:OprD family porin n=1 Tax=Azomonas macrocytogenes TaxID=69962 RepID=A0A839T6L0_AZOMA|nr:OprD family porin [Azomonas macrocytogenes]MBB3103585.1 hypothetical protein [Azomonas macrocytogenes]
MRYDKNPGCVFSLCAAFALPGLAVGEGFFEDAAFHALNRNFYFSQDFRNGDSVVNPHTKEKKGRRAEWAHGVIANFESGFTRGPVGFGLDLRGLYGVKLDGGEGLAGDGNGGPGLLPRRGHNRDGRSKSEFGRVDYELKMRFFDTELRYGDVRPASPVLNTSDIRLLPQSFRGALFWNTSIKGMTLQGGKLTSESDRTATGHNNDLGTAYGGLFKQADDFVYGGIDYNYDSRFMLRLHHGRLDNIWNQSAFYADWIQPLNDRLVLNANLRYYRTRDTGKALLGHFRSDSWSAQVGLTAGPHSFTVAHTRIDKDSPFDYVWHTWDYFLNTNSQVSDFNNPNERVWLFRYDYDFAAMGIPGLTLITRYVRGSDIDGRDVASGYSAYKNIRHGRHWERNFWLSYIVQGGLAKNLTFKMFQATHRVSGDHTAESNIDELRLILEYPLDLRLM